MIVLKDRKAYRSLSDLATTTSNVYEKSTLTFEFDGVVEWKDYRYQHKKYPLIWIHT